MSINQPQKLVWRRNVTATGVTSADKTTVITFQGVISYPFDTLCHAQICVLPSLLKPIYVFHVMLIPVCILLVMLIPTYVLPFILMSYTPRCDIQTPSMP